MASRTGQLRSALLTLVFFDLDLTRVFPDRQVVPTLNLMLLEATWTNSAKKP